MDIEFNLPPLPEPHGEHFSPATTYSLPQLKHYATQSYERGFNAAVHSHEVTSLREAVELCRVALEPYDDIKPRDWLTDRQNLRRAHQAACDALKSIGEQ